MAPPPNHSADVHVTVHLLDSAQGRSLQTWSFVSEQQITIGRSDDNSVVIADPHVSRLHAKLVRNGDDWTLISIGRHGTLIDDRLISETTVRDHAIFRLGPSGPMLRFDTTRRPPTRTETMENIDPDMFAILDIDEARKQHEVDQIAGNVLFQELQEQMRRMKGADTLEPNKPT